MPELADQFQSNHPIYRLSMATDRAYFDKVLSVHNHNDSGHPDLPIRLMVSLLIIQQKPIELLKT
jgi:hypothetical protein